MFYEVENRGNMIAAPKWYDSIRKHLAECGSRVDEHTGDLERNTIQ